MKRRKVNFYLRGCNVFRRRWSSNGCL